MVECALVTEMDAVGVYAFVRLPQAFKLMTERMRASFVLRETSNLF